jgi:methylmalonyl-CoA mutase cobalamin-binding subunit
MAGNDDKGTLRERSGSLVDGLAQTVISQVNGGAKYGTTRRLEAGTQLLLTAAIDRAPFNTRRVTTALTALRLADDDVLAYCIPDAARALGQDWLNDQLSFAHVSTASARLFGLCKEFSRNWRPQYTDPGSCSVILATIGREDHLVGPAVVTEQLRRQGHSVHMMLNADGPAILNRLRNVGNDAVFISCGSFRTLDLATKAIKTIKTAGVDLPVLLGGAIVGLDDKIERKTGADLVTNDIDTALDTLARLQLGQLGVG